MTEGSIGLYNMDEKGGELNVFAPWWIHWRWLKYAQQQGLYNNNGQWRKPSWYQSAARCGLRSVLCPSESRQMETQEQLPSMWSTKCDGGKGERFGT